MEWGDGEHRFRLPIGQLRELQEKCSAGPAEILLRIVSQKWLIDDIRETVRLGLIGGGMPPVTASALVKRYVDERPLFENTRPAQVILMAALAGVEDEPTGKEETPEAATENTGSNSPLSTDQGQ